MQSPGSGLHLSATAPSCAWLAWRSASQAFRLLLNRARSAVLVQNPDDRATVERLGIDPRSHYAYSGLRRRHTCDDAESRSPQDLITIAFVGRLLDDKGIRVLVAAHAILCQRGRDIRLLVAGMPDPANPTSIPAAEIENWRSRPNLVHLGFVEDIAGLWSAANIAVLPSRREGLPLSLLEAAACGRPLVATDVPGCREIARQDVNALLVPPDNPQALAEAIDRLAADPALRRKFGAASRQIVEQEFSDERVGRDTVALYRRLLHGVTQSSG